MGIFFGELLDRKTSESRAANGQAAAILAVATATAEGLRQVASRCAPRVVAALCSCASPRHWVEQFGQLAKAGNTFVVPTNLADIGSVIALAPGIGKCVTGGEAPR